MRKILCLAFAFAILFTGCSTVKQQYAVQQTYSSYKEIPGVTQNEIKGVEELSAEKSTFICGFPLSTEAFYNDDGSLGGFAPLLYKRMSELFDLNFVSQEYKWDEFLEKIDSMEIDFTSEFTPTSERLDKYFMTAPIVQRSIKVYTNKENDELKKMSRNRPVRCAFLNGTTLHSIAESSWDIPFEPVFLNNELEVIDYFMQDKIDAYIDENVMESCFEAYDFIDSTEYYPLNYSPVSLSTRNPELTVIIDIMDKYLNNGGLEELAELYKLGDKDYQKHRLSVVLTEEEKEYIKKHNDENTAIAIAYETDNYPSSFYNTKENEFQGAAIDVLEQISHLTGLKFRAGNKQGVAWSELLAGLERGEYSFTPELFKTSNRNNRFLWPAEPYYTNNYALISRADYPNVDVNQIMFNKVGLVENSAFSDTFFEWFPNSSNVVMYSKNTEAFDALEKGEIDLLMGTQNLLLYITNYQEKPNFKVNIMFDYLVGSYFGFNKNEEILCSIICKAQTYIDTEEISRVWKQKVFDYNSKLLKDTVPFAILFVAVLMVALLVVILLLLKNKRLSRNLEGIVLERTKELALQTATLTTIFESIPDLIFCKDSDSKFTRCNKSFEEHFGVFEKDIIGKDDQTALGLPSEAATAYRQLDRQIIEAGKPFVIEEVIPSADGKLPLFETVKIPLIQDGEAVEIICISRDITQRKNNEDALQLILDNLDVGIYINEIDTRKILFVNKKMANGFACQEYHDKVCWQVFQDGLSSQCDNCSIPKLLKSKDKHYVHESYNAVADSYYRNTDSIIKWHDGQLVHMQYAVDITELVKVQKELEYASRAKGDFLSRMSHEIRTPLNAIIGMNSIALNSNDLVKTHKCNEKIESASKHLLGVINDILDMSKIEANKFELTNNTFDFEKLLINITNVINFRTIEKRQELIVYIEKDVPSVIFSDELRLSQVITNLLANAVKFTPEKGSIALNVKKLSNTDDEVTLQIEVSDNGIGISAEQQKRLFVSFEQADNDTVHKFGGTGLGLAISKKIVELMGGTIWIESELGKGAKFIFTLKVKRSCEKTDKKFSPIENKDDIRILVVDDSVETRICFSDIMENHGLECLAAAGGEEALNMIKECGNKPYNIFFVDWLMPEMNGIELTKKIRETVDDAIVFLASGADWSSIEKEATAAGVTAFIPKPFFPSVIINSINSCVSNSSTIDENLKENEIISLDLSNHTILIVEDVEINREIIEALLEDTGAEIDFAEDGKKALEAFDKASDKYSLILMDIQMPVLGGYEATKAIRAFESAWAKEIPIIAMTANVFKEDIENCLSAGMNDHIGKPIDQVDLFNKLARYLS